MTGYVDIVVPDPRTGTLDYALAQPLTDTHVEVHTLPLRLPVSRGDIAEIGADDHITHLHQRSPLATWWIDICTDDTHLQGVFSSAVTAHALGLRWAVDSPLPGICLIQTPPTANVREFIAAALHSEGLPTWRPDLDLDLLSHPGHPTGPWSDIVEQVNP